MCGIVGYVGDRPAWPLVLEGLKRLEYRGYDSAGIAVMGPTGGIQFRKTVGKVSGLTPLEDQHFPPGFTAIGHTRWATHGKPSCANAHPQTGCDDGIAVVHNGIVENYLKLKHDLLARHHAFSSDTDTEVIAHLVEESVAQGYTLEEACLRLGTLLEGSQAIAVTCQGQEGMICALRLGRAGGMVVAHRDGQAIVGSDLPALLPVFQEDSPPGQVAFLDDGEMAVVSREGVRYLDLQGYTLQKPLARVSLEDVLINKGGYRHFMLKEIAEQPQAVASALRERVDFAAGRVEMPDFSLTTAEAQSLKRVVLIGCGTSLHAAQVGRYLVERLAGLPAEAESASEFRYRGAFLDRDALVVSVGQSGETADTVAAMQEVRQKGARLVTICNAEGSQAARLADEVLFMRSGIEIGVASTKTFTASLTILQLLAIYLGQARGFLDAETGRQLVEDISQCPRLLGDMLADTSQYQRLARRFGDYSNFLFLGRGVNAPIALEGALKLKEISYIHAEGHPAGEMKHGPIALVDRNMATVALAPRDGLYDKMAGNIKEVTARDGVVLAVLTQGDEELASQVDEALYIPPGPELLLPVLATIPLQLLAYHIASHRGCDVDQPRNLAKSVTVE